jgi:hypothetical protein
MTLELILFAVITSLLINGLSLWAFGYALRSHKHRILEMNTRLNYLETGMAYHDLIPMPWEIDDLDKHYEQINSFKQEGNVVYLQKEE